MGQQDVLPGDMSGDVSRSSEAPGLWWGLDETFTRVPGVELLGRHEAPDYLDERYGVTRPDGQVVVLTRLLYLIVKYADERLDPATQAALVSREYGRLLPVERLARLVDSRLAPAGLVVGTAGHPAATAAGHESAHRPRRRGPLLSVALRAPLVPTPVVRGIARSLAPAFHPAVVTVTLVAFVVSDVWWLTGAGGREDVVLTSAWALAAVLLLMTATTLWHAFGQAAGCHHAGGLPGAIAGGWYRAVPVLWTEVTNGTRIDSRGRLQADLGGLYFTALAVVAATAGYGLTGWAPAAVTALLANLAIPGRLIPLIRFDGYPLLAGLVGRPDLFTLIAPVIRSVVPGYADRDARAGSCSPGVRAAVVLWVVGTVAASAAALGLFLRSWPALVGSTGQTLAALWRSAADPSDPRGLIGSWIALVVLLLLVSPLTGSAALLARAGALILTRRHERPSSLPSPEPPEAAVTDSVTENNASHGGISSWLRPAPPSAAEPASPGTEAEEAPAGTGPSPVADAEHRPPSAADFTEETMLRARRTPPVRGWRRAVYLATNGNVAPAPSAAERRQAALVERIRRPVTSCRRIVVLSRKGGAGKTTTTLMLGHVLASYRGDRVVALDANPDAGSLAYRVARENSASITSLLANAERLSSYADVRAHTSQAPTRLEIIASDDDPRISQAMGQQDVKRAIDVLDRHFMLILLDTGTGILDDATQGILAEADQLVVVMPPALDGARVAASTLDWLVEHGYGRLVRSAVAAINAVQGSGGLVQLDRIERHFAERCSAVVRIPWDRSLEAGARTGLEDLRPRTLEAYLELAAAVVDRFPAPGSQPSATPGA